MRLSKIILQNFRNYREKQVFELNRSITILYGDNGNGKSSFFDGIEWCLTGIVSRFTEKKPPKEVLANKDMNMNEECSVEVHFSEFRIKRSFTKLENGYGNIEFSLFKLNKKIATGEGNVDLALKEIFLKNGKEYRNLKYKVGESINKAYILSQDQVTDFISKDKPSDRYSALASIMGFERVLSIRRNINTTIKSYKDIQEESSSLWENIKVKIEELQHELKSVDTSAMEKFKKIYKSEPNKKNIENKINKLQNELFGVENKYNEIDNLPVKSVGELQNKLLEIKNELKNLEQKFKETIIEKDSLVKNRAKIDSLLKNLSDNRDKKLEVIDLNRKLVEINNELSSLTIEKNSFEGYKNAISVLHREQRLLEFAKVNRKKHNDLIAFLDNYEEKNNETKLRLLKCTEELDEIIKKEKLLSMEILALDEESSVTALIKSIEQVSGYIEQNKINDVCPVCLSDLNGELQVKVATNLNSLISTISEKKDSLVEKINKKQGYDSTKAQLENEIQKLEFKVNDLINQKKISEESIQFILNNELYSKYFKYSEEEIDEIIKRCDYKFKKYQNGLKLIGEISSIEEKLKNINVDSNLLKHDIQELREKSIQLEDEIREIDKLNESLNREISKRKDEIFELKHLENKIRSNLENYSVDNIQDLLGTLLKKNHDIKNQISFLKNIINLLDTQNHNYEVNKKMSVVQQKKDIVEKKLLKVERNIIDLEEILNRLDVEYGEEANTFLNREHSAIQTYYKYLNPSPSEFNKLIFKVEENEELYIKISDDEINDLNNPPYCVEANMVLSSGQLNVLALAIFIATNEAQDNSYFDFIAIDDPIQNMDDVNRFSICDVLAQLNRQLIFSTHDQDFLNLFLKKNEKYLENITLYLLDSNENNYVPLNG